MLKLNSSNPHNNPQKVYFFPKREVIRDYLERCFEGEEKENFSSIDKKMIDAVSVYFSNQARNSWEIRKEIAGVASLLEKQKNRLRIEFVALLNLQDALVACAENNIKFKKQKSIVAAKCKKG